MYNQLVTALICSIVCLSLESAQVSSNHVPTQISIYYETLCPDSQRFFLRQLAPTYEKLNRYMDVELVPFGNANVSYPRHDNRPVFMCQHGPNECYGNRVQACAITSHDTSVSINYIRCMFQHNEWRNTEISAESCAQQLGLEWPKIKSCADGSEGERLLIANSLKTFNLNPEHSYIPWIVIDKNHTKALQTKAESYLLKLLCDSYFGHDPQIPHCKEEAIQSQSQQASGNRVSGDSWLYIGAFLLMALWSLP